MRFALARWLLGIALVSPDVEAAELVIESWRIDDAEAWSDAIIPAFEAAHPEIDVAFRPIDPRDYHATLSARLEAGEAGDLIACRPFGPSERWFERGWLAPLSDLSGLERFPAFALASWSTADGAQTFCAPIASTIHGFVYNAEIFGRLGLEPPRTEAEFFATLEAIAAEGSYDPLAIGTADQWEAAASGYANIGPAYWRGEIGRRALARGEAAFTDEPFVAPFRALERWADHLPDGFAAQSYADSRNAFVAGEAAIFPTGSWEIASLADDAEFELGAFAPPARADGDPCWIAEHPDLALGLNAGGENLDAARRFLEWTTSADFAQLLVDSLPGSFPLSGHPLTFDRPLARAFASWRARCGSSLRPIARIGDAELWSEMWRVSSGVLEDALSPEEAAARLRAMVDGGDAPAN